MTLARNNPSRRPLHLLVALALLCAPVVRGAPACAAVTDQPPNPAGLYVLPQAWEVWLESNAEPGLQRQACERPDLANAGPDTFVLDLAAAMG
ncbi:MAG TPA: hypothetical protein VNX21_02765 [Candidatus Thermoplasmatota archaeon]|nr:hypothetical protein [Candidatus Thermoplasmatota archaeon]